MKIVIEMSLAKYIDSGLCSRNATEWGKFFSYDELDQLESILQEMQENETIDETTIDNYFDEDPAMLANWIGKWDSEFFGDNVRWALNNFNGDYEINPENIDPSDNETMYYDSIERDLEYEIKQSLSHDGYDNVTDQVKFLVSDIVENYKSSKYPQTNDGLSDYLQNVKLSDLF
jgi:hypothetical protein